MMDKDAITGVIVDAAIRIHKAFGLAFPSVRMTESFVRCCLVGVDVHMFHVVGFFRVRLGTYCATKVQRLSCF